MPTQANDPDSPVGKPPASTQPVKRDTKQGDDPPAGEGEAANDPPAKRKPERNPDDDEETMPIEEGFSIVP